MPRRLAGAARPNRAELEELLGDLDRVGRRPFAEVVADTPKQQAVRSAEILADPADEDLVAVRGGGGKRIRLRGGVVDHDQTGAFAQTARAASGVIGLSVSTKIDSLWL